MDFDPCQEFYDNLSPLTSADCSFDELEEILRSTDANLSSGQGCTFQMQMANDFQSYPSPPTSSSTPPSCSHKSESDSYLEFNPDDFMNLGSEEDGKSETRSTPSPQYANSPSPGIKNVFIDSPPMSPPNNLYHLPTSILPIAANTKPISMVQGTLIPVQTVPLTTVQVQAPKIVKTSSPGTKSKTIVLSSKDFKSLLHKINNVKGGGQLMPKIIMKPKPTSPHQKKPTVLPKISPMSPCKSSDSETASGHEVKFFKTMVDEKHLKKQQRMIKNRESASLSRKKKKEYVTSLESRISDLEKENNTLKGENTTLRSQLIAFAQACQCNRVKLSEFISNKLSSNILGISHPAGANIKARFLNTNMKKNTAVLLAMVFMISVNIGSFQTYFSRDERLFSSRGNLDISLHNTIQPQRRLLWVDEVNQWNNTGQGNSVRYNRNLTTKIPDEDKCPLGGNQTENLRLATELRKWINVNDNLNLSTSSHLREFDIISHIFDLREPLSFGNNAKASKRNRKQIFSRHPVRSKTKYNSKHSLQVYQWQVDEEYLRLFESINRRDDTFYVLSFNSDHILLPAAAYNKSSRPKMSLMLPAGDPTIDGDIMLMQIDCVVVNTTEVQLKADVIPLNFRPKQSVPNVRDILNKTEQGPVRPPHNDIYYNTFKDDKKPGAPNQFYRPYFVDPFPQKDDAYKTRRHSSNP